MYCSSARDFCAQPLNVRSINPGLDSQRLLVVNVNFSGAGYQAAESEALYRRMMERAETIPGVESASAVNSVPFQSSWRTRIYIPGRDPEVWGEEGGGRYNRLSSFVTANFSPPQEQRFARTRIYKCRSCGLGVGCGGE
ncbi:MAG: hypothetical protein WKF84_09565 [Pyrinomonadaceae bacterium]